MRTNRMGVMGSLVVGAAVAWIALAPSGAATALSGGSCVSGVVPVSFVLPDGSVHPAGEFTACPDRRLSPVQSLQRLSAAGSTQGLFVATVTSAEAETVRPYLTFHRVGSGEWILVGITLPPAAKGDPSISLRLADRRRVAELVMQRTAEGLLARGTASGTSEVVLAARLR